MIELSFANDLGRWLLTYLVHSTILLASAWLLTRRIHKHAEALWTAALLGGLLTTSLQVGLGYGSIIVPSPRFTNHCTKSAASPPRPSPRCS